MIDNYIKFAILCGKQVCKNETWNKWAENWLLGIDRSKKSAEGICRFAYGNPEYDNISGTCYRYNECANTAYTVAYIAANPNLVDNSLYTVIYNSYHPDFNFYNIMYQVFGNVNYFIHKMIKKAEKHRTYV